MRMSILLALAIIGCVAPNGSNGARIASRSDSSALQHQQDVNAALLVAQQQQQVLAKELAKTLQEVAHLPAEARHPVKVASHGVAGSRGEATKLANQHKERQHHEQHSLGANMAKLLQFPKKFLAGLSNNAEEKAAEKQQQQRQLEQAAAAVAAAAAVRKARARKHREKVARKQDASATASPTLVAKLTGTTAGGYSSPGLVQDTHPSGSTAVKKSSTSTYDDADPYSTIDVGALGANYASAAGGNSASAGGSGASYGDVGDGYGDDSGVSHIGYGKAVGGATYADPAGHGGYVSDLSSYGTIDTAAGGAGGLLGNFASGLLRDSAGLLKGLGFLLPVGLFLAALPPNVINVAVTGDGVTGLASATTSIFGKRRKRSPIMPTRKFNGEREHFSYPADHEEEYPAHNQRLNTVSIHNNGWIMRRSDDVADAPVPETSTGSTLIGDDSTQPESALEVAPSVAEDAEFVLRQQDSAGGAEGVGEVDAWPILDKIDAYGVTAVLTEADCQKRVFCELVQLGRLPEGNAVQRSLWAAVRTLPHSLIGTYVDANLLRAVQSGECQKFFCPERAIPMTRYNEI